MRFGKALMAVAVATSLVSTPVIAGAQNLSIASAQREAASVNKGENLKGSTIIITLLSIITIVAGVVVSVKDNDEGLPVSP